MKRTLPLAAAAILVLGLGAGATYAASQDDGESISTAGVTVSLSQAVATAENHVNGKAVSAELERSKQGPVYDVTVVKGKTGTEVTIDARKGTVVATGEDGDYGEHDDD